MEDNYLKALHADKKEFKEYYLGSVEKTEQQKFLELLLQEREKSQLLNVADLACGAGTLSYHLSSIYKKAKFSLIDYNADSIELAKILCKGSNFNFLLNDIKNLPFKNNSFDAIFCWMTLFILEENAIANVLDEIIRVLKPGQRAYLSSLFNLDHDVDLYTKIVDHTRESSKLGYSFNYNTYCQRTVSKMLEGKVSKFEIVKFVPQIDINCDNKGIGTYTQLLENGERLQISAGLLMNWGVLIIEK